MSKFQSQTNFHPIHPLIAYAATSVSVGVYLFCTAMESILLFYHPLDAGASSRIHHVASAECEVVLLVWGVGGAALLIVCPRQELATAGLERLVAATLLQHLHIPPIKLFPLFNFHH